MNFNMTQEIFGFESDLGIEKDAPTPREIVIPTGAPTGPPVEIENEFMKAAGIDDVVDDCGFPMIMQKSAPALTFAQRAAQAIAKSVNAVFPRVEYIAGSASARQARIAEILDKARQSLRAKGYAPDGWDGWSALAKHADEFVISVLMEA
jgi:hypothetical protein